MVLDLNSPAHTLWKSDLYRIQVEAPVPIPILCDDLLPDRPYFLGQDYHGAISHVQAAQLLDTKENGAYLVRTSRSANGEFYTLSLRFNGKIHHYKLYFDPDGALYVGEKRYDCARSLVADGLVTMYIELKAPTILQKLASVNYQESPYMTLTLNKRKLRILSKQNLVKQNPFENFDSDNGNNNPSFTDQVCDENLTEKAGKPHLFKLTTFKGLNWCELCANFLWGFTLQGKKCDDCGVIAHIKCSEKFANDCIPDLKYLRGVFGIELTTLLCAYKANLPFVVTKCVAEVEARGLTTEGIYRLSGFADEIDAIKMAFDKDGERADLSMEKYPNINVITGALKLYLRILPVPLITFEVHPRLIDAIRAKIMACFCQGLCPYGMEYGTCQTKPGGKCFTSVELDVGDDGNEHPVLSYGCMPPNEMALFQCRSNLIASREGKNIRCCDEYDFCNKHLLPVVEKVSIEQNGSVHTTTLKVLLSSFAVCVLFFLAGIYLIFLKFKKDLQRKSKESNKDGLPQIEMSVAPDEDNGSFGEDSGIRIGAECSDSLGDSSGITSELVQRTIAKQIKLEEIIAEGVYSEIWKAKWRGEAVSVKVYNFKEERKWINETQIFQTPLIRHEHILGYIAADIKGSKPSGKLFLISEYHPQGTLRGYLQNHTLASIEIFNILKGLASALNHLHTEIIGRSKKPSITHNNINSNNILVKSDRTCCFANFSKATSFSNENSLLLPTQSLNDDIRYLAPEFLHKPYATNSESYKMSDIYSFSLIIWEILMRYANIPNSKHALPYEELDINNKSSLAEHVLVKKVRPEIKPEWSEDPFLKMALKIMVESWNHVASARLTSLRIKKTFFKIQEDIFKREVD